ncbi:MAG: hypothetical protein H8E40_01065, partial [Chloroflexi bacterium]|nr:hypothetical protein [Chloroflexota bacterium]
MATYEELAEKVKEYQDAVISYATGGRWDELNYKRLREELLSEPAIAGILPRFVQYCVDLLHYWHFIKGVSPKYKGRREYLWSELGPVINQLKLSGVSITTFFEPPLTTDIDPPG